MEKDYLREINETLKKIENKIEDNSSSRLDLTHIFDFEKSAERERKKREEERKEETIKIQKKQSEMMEIQTNSIMKQENFNKMVAFTGGVLALVTIYNFLVQGINLEPTKSSYWVITLIFLILLIFCLGPLISFILDCWKEFWSTKKRNFSLSAICTGINPRFITKILTR